MVVDRAGTCINSQRNLGCDVVGRGGLAGLHIAQPKFKRYKIFL